MSDRRIIEEEQEYDERPSPRIIGPNVPRARVTRYRRWITDAPRPSALSLLLGLAIGGLIAAGVYYYYLGHRSFNNDISELRTTSKDAATTAAVKTAYSLNKQLNDDSINVDTSNGTVTLNGQVANSEERQTAEQIARDTRGVTNVVNNLSVSPAGQQEEAVKNLQNEKQSLESRTQDLQLQAQILQTFLTIDSLKGQQIKVNVSNHVATLEGMVDSPQQKDIAVATAQHVNGVKEVKADQLAVRYQQATQPYGQPPEQPPVLPAPQQ